MIQELQEAAGLQDAKRLGERALGFRKVHQRHERRRRAKGGVAKWQLDGAGDAVVDTQWIALLLRHGVRDEALSDVDARHTRPARGEQSRVVPLAAPDVEDRQAGNVRKHREECRAC